MKRYYSIVAWLAFALGSPAAAAQDVGGGVKGVAPFVGDDVAVVARLDLKRLDPAALARQLLGGVMNQADKPPLDRVVEVADRWINALKDAGAKELFLLLDPSDMPGPPVAVVPLGEGADAAAIARALGGDRNGQPIYHWPATATVRGALVAGSAAALERIRRTVPPARPELLEAAAAAGDGPVQILLLPGPGLRKVVEETLPNLPQELGGGPITPISRGLNWAALALQAGPKPNIHVAIEAADAPAAKTIVKIGQDALALLGQKPAFAEIGKDLARIKPEVAGHRVSIDVDLETSTALVGVPLRGAREAATRSQCINNLKQIGLAMHNYHCAQSSFPPAATRDKQGRPLLSWRVLILPYLEQQALYEQFHLDEPWDSPHNKPLAAMMPRVYACPSSSAKLAAEGKTTYLVPLGESTVFTGGEGVKLAEITDGTSNTVLAVDADDDRAVVWTKPDDWEVGPATDKAGLFGKHPGITIVLNGDGSVRAIKATTTPEMLRALVTRSGGEVIDWTKY
jgi:hypothetical protein